MSRDKIMKISSKVKEDNIPITNKFEMKNVYLYSMHRLLRRYDFKLINSI